MKFIPLCPQCKKPLEEVRYPDGCMLNRDQFDSIRAGDYYCTSCKGNEAKSGFKYWWEKEVINK